MMMMTMRDAMQTTTYEEQVQYGREQAPNWQKRLARKRQKPVSRVILEKQIAKERQQACSPHVQPLARKGNLNLVLELSITRPRRYTMPYRVHPEHAIRTFGIALRPSLMQALRRAAAERNTSVSALVRSILERSQVVRQARQWEVHQQAA